MTENMEKAIKDAIAYTENRKAECRYCQNVRIDDNCMPPGGREWRCTVAGKIGEFTVRPDATCRLFEERK